MSALSILIVCGFAYLMFVTWIFRRKGGAPGDGNPAEKKPKEGAPRTEPQDNGAPLVPKSDFDYCRFQKAMTDSMTAALTYVLQANVGDVAREQVEFRKDGDKDDDSPDTDTPDMSDVEPGEYSPPATGETIEDIEAALNVAADAKATPDEKAKAGKVLSEMKSVVFIGQLMESSDRINDGIMACIAESMRRGSKKPKGSPSPKKKKEPLDVGGVLRDPDMIRRKKDDDEED